jgi:glutamate decarboxylase
VLHHHDPGDATIEPLFGSRTMREPIARDAMPRQGIGAPAAAQLITDELSLDGNPLLNLASFVTTWMDPEADKLLADALDKNYIDQEEYPRTSELERRCVSMIAALFHGTSDSVGTSTIGSSEAIHLAGMAMKRRWKAKVEAAGGTPGTPNLVMSSAVHVTWEKFCRYFEVECREVPCEEGRLVLDVQQALDLVDENTIGVVGILGTTFTGQFDPIGELNDALAAHHEATGQYVPLHVDAASGGFVAPFVHPDFRWDFQLEHVHSINVSGHKYGLVYPGVGWALWKAAEDLPEELIFTDSYLGAEQSTFDLNFSRSASQIIGQYYNLIRLGFDGYVEVMQNLKDIAGYLKDQIVERGTNITVLSEDVGLPLVSVKLAEDRPFTAHDVAFHLRARGWIVPAYTLPKGVEDQTALRVVVREGFNRPLCDVLIDHIIEVVEELVANPPAQPKPTDTRKNRPC